jgi:hypothetical protein
MLKAEAFKASLVAVFIVTAGAMAAGQGSYRPDAPVTGPERIIEVPGFNDLHQRPQAQTSASTTAPASEPATSQEASSQPAGQGTLAKIEQQLRLNDHDRQLVTGIRDGKDWKSEAAFYMLIGRLAKLQAKLAQEKITLTLDQLHRLDKPSFSSLLRDPDFYHGRPNSADPGPMLPVQLKVRVFQVVKCSAENGRLDINKSYWDDKRPVWMISGLKADGENPTAEPVVVYSIVEPPNLGVRDEKLPQGEKADPDNTFYSNGPVIEVAGILYKKMQALDRGAKGLHGAPDRDPEMRTYPILLAWQIFGGVEKEATIDDQMGQWQVIIVGLVVAGVFFFFLFMRNARRGRTRLATDSTPFRAVRAKMKEEREKARQKGIFTEDEGDGPVDEELAKAAEEYKKRKENDANSQR